MGRMDSPEMGEYGSGVIEYNAECYRKEGYKKRIVTSV